MAIYSPASPASPDRAGDVGLRISGSASDLNARARQLVRACDRPRRKRTLSASPVCSSRSARSAVNETRRCIEVVPSHVLHFDVTIGHRPPGFQRSAYSGGPQPRIAVSARTTLRRLTQFSCESVVVRFNVLNPNVIASALGRSSDVCDNLTPTARKYLILKRRDVRVVEGARLESDSGDAQRDTPKHPFAQSIQRHPATRCVAMRTRKQGCSSATSKRPYTVSTQS